MSRRRDSPGRVLVANRGEIAVRIIRACRELGRSPVAVYANGEERALHVRLADDGYRLPAGAGLPYLDIDALVAIARRAKVDAIHPGYGFLAENAAFAEACGEAGFVFVGPSVAAIRAMGDKVEARRIARSAGLPVVPGSDGPVATIEEATAWAAEHGYPLAVKAAGGGGGRGFRVARREPELADAFAGSVGEARRYFANPVVYLERYLERPRHIEIQLFADQLGNTVALGERDCSIQRRHQKLIEETPSPAVGADLRASLEAAALALARAVSYVGAGTVEFLLDEAGDFYFLEMNTRIQVEHTVTEAVTGLDLVVEQLRVASGMPLSFQQEDVHALGHAIECRINAEDPGRDFAPTPGTLGAYLAPAGPGVRVDSAMEPEARIDPAYDSLIAKVTVWDRDRPRAIARMRRALREFQISGLPTTIPFHLAVLDHPVFIAGEATTAFLAEHPEVIPRTVESQQGAEEPNGQEPPTELIVEVDNRRFNVRVLGHLSAAKQPTTPSRTRPLPAAGERGGAENSGGAEVVSPVQGTVISVAVVAGQQVERGAVICVVEAMKMENEITAHQDGSVLELLVAMGERIGAGAVIARIGANSKKNS